MKKHIFFIIPIVLASIALAPIGASASTEETCSEVPDDNAPGWTIQTCSNGEVTRLGPDGQRCAGNEASSVISCENSDGSISRINPAD